MLHQASNCRQAHCFSLGPWTKGIEITKRRSILSLRLYGLDAVYAYNNPSANRVDSRQEFLRRRSL